MTGPPVTVSCAPSENLNGLSNMTDTRIDSRSDTAQQLLARVQAFMENQVLPHETTFRAQVSTGDRWQPTPIVEALKVKAHEAGLWNLFLPDSESRRRTRPTPRYAPICEAMGSSPMFAPEIFNCSAPDTGNMEVLVRYGTPEQKRQWLDSAARRARSARALR